MRPSSTFPAPNACTAQPGLTLAACQASRGRDRHLGIGRAVAQQVPGQARLRSRKAARLLDDRPGRGRARLPRRPVAVFPGIGKVTQERLAKDDITHRRTRCTPLGISPGALARSRLARPLLEGEDARPVRPERATKSVSAETTFDPDLAARGAAADPARLCEKVARRLKAAGLAGGRVALKLKDAQFRLRTRTARGCRRRSLPAGSTTRRRGCCGPNATAPPSASSASAPPTCATPPRPIAATSPTPRWCATQSSRRRSIVCAKSSERPRSSAASSSTTHRAPRS